MDRETDLKQGESVLTCGIVRDLLAFYREKITSVVTAEMIEKHLEKCATCREALEKLCWQEEQKEQEERARGRNFQKKLLSVKYQLLGFLAGLLVPVVSLLLPTVLSLVSGWLFGLL